MYHPYPPAYPDPAHHIPYPIVPPAIHPPGKRRRDDFEAAVFPPSCYPNLYYAPGQLHVSEEAGPKRAKTQDVVFRVVVPSRHIGKVIGKEGCRIQKIREDSRATVKIADAIARHEERVIIISSKDRESAGPTDAENALRQIAALILKEDGSGFDAAKLVDAGHVAANTIRLLIAGTQAGSLIGISGQNIEKLRESSGATITVLAPNQLPLCASALESDRIVQISGELPDVMQALKEIGSQLRENPPKQVISISPAYNYNTARPQLPYMDPTLDGYLNLEMMVPEALVGGLIGRCGSNISRIRSESGAAIKVHGGKGAQKHRQIQFGGSANQVALAKLRVDEYIHSQLGQQTDTEQEDDEPGMKNLCLFSVLADNSQRACRSHSMLYLRKAGPALSSSHVL